MTINKQTNRLSLEVEADYSFSYVLKSWSDEGFTLLLDKGGFIFEKNELRITFYLEEVIIESNTGSIIHLTSYEANLIAATLPYAEPLINLKLMAYHRGMYFSVMVDGSIFFGQFDELLSNDVLATFRGELA